MKKAKEIYLAGGCFWEQSIISNRLKVCGYGGGIRQRKKTESDLSGGLCRYYWAAETVQLMRCRAQADGWWSAVTVCHDMFWL